MTASIPVVAGRRRPPPSLVIVATTLLALGAASQIDSGTCRLVALGFSPSPPTSATRRISHRVVGGTAGASPLGDARHGPTTSRTDSCLAAGTTDDDSDDDFLIDDDDFFEDDAALISRATSAASARLDDTNDFDRDLSGCKSRRFSLGYDLLLDTFVGSMGFDEVTDWNYYEIDVDEDGKRDPRGGDKKMITPNPLDPSQPRRTRESSGGVVRVFRADLTGRLGGTLRSRGLDRRVIVKEFAGSMGKELADGELRAAARLQTELILNGGGDDGARLGTWGASGADRYVEGKTKGVTIKDDTNLVKLMGLLGGKNPSPHVGVLGVLDLTEYLMDPDPDAANEWYRALKVPPPKPGSTWIVYEYAGLSTLMGYARPPAERVAQLPLRRGVFGDPKPPPPLPQWRDRANYVVTGVLRGALSALADVHDAGLVHRSVGRPSVLLGSVGQDKAEGADVYSTVVARLAVKLSDLGFSVPIADAHANEAFRARARAFDVPLEAGFSTPEARNFAIAEDLHALGFVFLGTLLTALAVTPTPGSRLPPNTDEDGLQRLLGDIFGGSFKEFRDYVSDEGEVWANVVTLLDEDDGAGWDLLEDMCLARERAAELGEGDVGTTARSLLDSPLFRRR